MQGKEEHIGQEVPPTETERLILRELRPEDAEGLWNIFSDPEVLRYVTFDPKIRSVDDARDYVAQDEADRKDQTGNHRLYKFAIVMKETDETFGLSLLYVDKDKEGRGWIAEGGTFLRSGDDVRGKEYGPESQEARTDYAFRVFPEVDIVAGRYDPTNRRSKGAMRKLGAFTFIKTILNDKYLGPPENRWRDSDYYEVTRAEWETWKLQELQAGGKVGNRLNAIRINGRR